MLSSLREPIAWSMKLSNYTERTIEVDNIPARHFSENRESGVDVPWDSINPDTLRNLIAEYVTREWTDTEYTLEIKTDQVLQQLHNGQAKIVFDLATETCNIIPSKECNRN